MIKKPLGDSKQKKKPFGLKAYRCAKQQYFPISISTARPVFLFMASFTSFFFKTQAVNHDQMVSSSF